MSRRWKILVVACVALATVVLIPVIRHYQLRAATEAYIAELKAKGEPMELAQVIPPPVPPEQNSADTFRKAAALIEADESLLTTNSYSAMRMIAPGKAMICWQQPDARGYNATNSWEEVIAGVNRNAEALKLLDKITAQPALDFHIHYERGLGDAFDFTDLNLAPLKKSALYLSVASLCNLHQGKTDFAAEDLRAMLALVKAAQDERFVISELVRIADTSIATTVNWEILQATNLTDGQLAELQHDWTDLDFIRAEENALAMERVTGEITLAQWRNSGSQLLHYLQAPYETGLIDQRETLYDKLKIRINAFLWRYWWSYPDELRALKGYEVLLTTARSAPTNHSFQIAMDEQTGKLERLGILALNRDELAWLNPAKADMHSILSESILTLDRVFDKVMRAEAAKQVVVTAIALKRYQLKHGNYPVDLNALVPGFIPAVPLDPVDGKPLRYRRNADDTFLLYSVGENGKDDGNNPSLEKGFESLYPGWQSPHALDWVWPQPATEDEIQNYHAHPPE